MPRNVNQYHYAIALMVIRMKIDLKFNCIQIYSKFYFIILASHCSVY